MCGDQMALVEAYGAMCQRLRRREGAGLSKEWTGPEECLPLLPYLSPQRTRRHFLILTPEESLF